MPLHERVLTRTGEKLYEEDRASRFAALLIRAGERTVHLLEATGVAPHESLSMRARLREAACLLSDLGWREHPDYRSEQAFMRVLRMPVAGIDHAERVILALAMAIRYGADLDETHYADPFMQLMKDDDVAYAWRIGAVIRLAYSLSGGTLVMLNQTRLSKKDGKICLHLPEDSRLLFGEAVQRRLDAVGRAFDKAVQIV